MDHRSVDLSIVKKEPGLEEICHPSHNVLDNMLMAEDFQDNFHCPPPSNEDVDVPVDWLTSFFDDPTAIPSCADQMGSYTTNSVPEYSMSAIHLNSLGRTQHHHMNGIIMDGISSFPEDTHTTDSLYCSTPRSPDFDHTPDTTDPHELDDDMKHFFPRHHLVSHLTTQGSVTSQMNSHLDHERMDKEVDSRGLIANSREIDVEKVEAESGYDSASSHSPTCVTPSTPPRTMETDDLSPLSDQHPCEQVNDHLSCHTQHKQPFNLSEEEKRTLVAEGLPVPTGLPLTKLEERALKKVRRKIKNKISAQESRRKKKEYMESLERKVESFTNENTDLRKKLDSLETTNRSLISQLQKLQSLLSNKVQRPSSARGTQTGSCLMVVVLCFAIFVGSWFPGSNNLIPPTTVSVSSAMPVAKSGVDYTTPPVRSRVLLSMMDDYDGDEGEMAFAMDPFDAIKATPVAALNPVPQNLTQELTTMTSTIAVNSTANSQNLTKYVTNTVDPTGNDTLASSST